MSSGLAFAEFSDPAISLFAVRYLNNMQLAGNRPLVVDFALDDARKLQKRVQKLEKHQRLALETKTAAKKEARNAKRHKVDVVETNIDASQGIQITSQQRAKVSIADCEDLEALKAMLEQPIARGKKQRIRKKIQTLQDPEGLAAAKEKAAAESKNGDKTKKSSSKSESKKKSNDDDKDAVVNPKDQARISAK